MEGKTVMLTYMQRGVGLVALLSINLMGSDGDVSGVNPAPKTVVTLVAPNEGNIKRAAEFLASGGPRMRLTMGMACGKCIPVADCEHTPSPYDDTLEENCLSATSYYEGKMMDYLGSIQAVALFENNYNIEKANAAILAKFNSSEWQSFLESQPLSKKTRLSIMTTCATLMTTSHDIPKPAPLPNSESSSQ